MKALTIWQPWASLIIAGAKPYEFRRWSFAERRDTARLVGQRIAIHAGMRKVKHKEVVELLYRLRHQKGAGTGLVVEKAVPVLERVLTAPDCLPRGAVLGSAIFGRPRKAATIFRGDVADSDRLDHSIWAWPLTEIERLEPPLPARGAQGFWNWS